MEILVFCPKCARVQIGKSDESSKPCPDCGASLIKTEILNEDDPSISSHEWFELRRKIYNEMIEPLGQLDTSLESFKYFYNEYFGDAEQKQNDFWEIQKLKKKIEEKQKELLPKCPTCGSTNIKKIGTGNKVGSAALLGIFSLGHISKTFKCQNCGYKW